MPCVASARVRCARCVWSFERVLRVNEPKAPRLRHSRGRALGVRGAPLLRARASPPLDRAPPRSRLAPSHARPAFSSQVAGARLEIDGRDSASRPHHALPSARTARARPARAVGEPAAREGAEARARRALSPPHRALTPPGARAAMPPPGEAATILPTGPEPDAVDVSQFYVPAAALAPCADPAVELAALPAQLDSDSWVVACGGLLVARRLAAHHPDALAAKLRDFLPRLRRLANNLRSSVARTALVCAADVFAALGDDVVEHLEVVEEETDAAGNTTDACDDRTTHDARTAGSKPPPPSVLATLLHKAALDKRFVADEAKRALGALVAHADAARLAPMLLAANGSKNDKVRAVIATCAADVAAKAAARSCADDAEEGEEPSAASSPSGGRRTSRGGGGGGGGGGDRRGVPRDGLVRVRGAGRERGGDAALRGCVVERQAARREGGRAEASGAPEEAVSGSPRRREGRRGLGRPRVGRARGADPREGRGRQDRADRVKNNESIAIRTKGGFGIPTCRRGGE